MRSVFLVLLVALMHTSSADDLFASSGPVPLLLPETFDAQLAKLPNVTAVMFYAPWCGHCKEFKPVFEGAAQLIRMNKLKLGLAAINGDNNRALAQKFGIKGFPTLKLFRDGAVVDEYRGSRTAESLVVWMESFQMDVVTNLTSIEQVKEFSAYRTVTLLGHFHPANGGAQKAFHDACKAVRGLPGYEHVRCAEIVSGKTATYFGLGETPAMKIVRKWKGSDTENEKKTMEFDWFSSWNTKTVADWVKTYSYPLLGEITPEVYGKLERRGSPLLWVFVPGHGTPPPHAMTGEHELPRNTPEQARANNATKKVAREVAKELGSKFTVVWLSGLDFPDQASSLGVDPSDLPSVAIQTPSPKRERFAYDRSVYGPFSKESIIKFANDFDAKKLKLFIKSQPVPVEPHVPGQVQDVVALDFKEQVYDSDKDVFLMFYAPWCQHCQQAEPVWRDLAARLADASDVVIARIDATANDVPRDIPGFPTFYLKKASNKKAEIDSANIYDGERTVDGFLAFLKERGSTKALADFKAPADVRRVSYFLSQLDSTKTEIEKLIQENEDLRAQVLKLKAQVAQCGGSDSKPKADKKTNNKDEL